MIIWILFKTVPTYSWIFIYFRKSKIYVISIKLVEKLPRRHLINSSDVFLIKGFTVGKIICAYRKNYWCIIEKSGLTNYTLVSSIKKVFSHLLTYIFRNFTRNKHQLKIILFFLTIAWCFLIGHITEKFIPTPMFFKVIGLLTKFHYLTN